MKHGKFVFVTHFEHTTSIRPNRISFNRSDQHKRTPVRLIYLWPALHPKEFGNWVDRKGKDVSDQFSSGTYYDRNRMFCNGELGHPLQCAY